MNHNYFKNYKFYYYIKFSIDKYVTKRFKKEN